MDKTLTPHMLSGAACPPEIIYLYEKTFSTAPARVVKLTGGGGDRRYFRLMSDLGSAVGTVADVLSDARAFLRLDAILKGSGVNVPEVLDAVPDGRYYLLEDLGDTSLLDIIKAKGEEGARELVADTLESLAQLQTIDRALWSGAVGYAPMSRRQVMWDLNYFKYEYLKPSGAVFDEDALEDDFEALAERLLEPTVRWGLMYRDCQSRNVMVKGGRPYFIDFQGARFGPCLYDAVSFLWQAKAGFSPAFRREMLDLYIEKVSVTSDEARAMAATAPTFVLFRTLQVLGAYGFRGLVQKRAHFIESIPGALANLRELLELGEIDSYPELKAVAGALVSDSRFAARPSGNLKIDVFSFSYKKGYPDDFSGNGGGFMFDCRGMHNPGRYEEYKHLTGEDDEVRSFLQQRGEAERFVGDSVRLVSPTVERYLERGFTGLQIGFGCTGGQHRSVYCASRVAALLKEKFPQAVIELNHREQNIRKTL